MHHYVRAHAQLPTAPVDFLITAAAARRAVSITGASPLSISRAATVTRIFDLPRAIMQSAACQQGVMCAYAKFISL